MSSTSSDLNSEIVQAGAGAGKTTYLVQKVCDAFAHFRAQEVWPRFIVSTFSRKATQEVKERLLLKALQSGDEEFLRFVSSPNQLFVTTIHGVLLQFLTRYASKLQLQTDLKMVNAAELLRRDTQIMRELIKECNGHELVMEWRLRELVEMGSQYYQLRKLNALDRFISKDIIDADICRLTNALKEELTDFLKQLRDNGEAKWAVLIQPCSELNAGLPILNFEQLKTNYERMTVLRGEIKKPRRVGAKEKHPHLHDQCEDILVHLDEVLTYEPMFVQKKLHLVKNLEPLFELFTQRRFAKILEQGEIAFDDLESLSMTLIKTSPETAKEFSTEWNYWCLDEFQDTSPVQIELLEKLIGETPYFVVGDPQQSIYLFRGARSEVFSERINKINQVGGDFIRLKKNYRSQPGLLAFINDYFSQFGGRFEKMEPRDANDSDEVSSKQAQQINIVWTESTEAEIAAAVQNVRQLLAQGATASSIVILSRRRRHINDMARALHMEGIPCFAHVSSGFGQRREVQDILALLRFTFVQQDNYNLIYLCRSPWFFIEDWKIAELRAQGDEKFWTVLQQKLSTHPSVMRLSQYLIDCHKNGIASTLVATLKERGFFDASYFVDPSGRREANAWKIFSLIDDFLCKSDSNILQLESQILSQVTVAGDGLSDAVSAIEPNRVNLMTIHGSKGLQFEHVLIPFMGEAPQLSNEPLFVCDEQTQLAGIKIRNQEDERRHINYLSRSYESHRQAEELEVDRLLYVAMTRAKQTLYLSSQAKFAAKSWAKNMRSEIGIFRGTGYNLNVSAYSTPELEHAKNLQSTTKNLDTHIDVSNTVSAAQVVSPWTEIDKGSIMSSHGVTELIDKTAQHALHADDVSKDNQQVWGRVQRTEQGVVLHRILEALKYHGVDGVRRLVEKSFNKEVDRIMDALEFVVRSDRPPMTELLKSGFAEWGFSLRDKDDQGVEKILRGQIDLWGQVNDETWIIDYKTGQLQTEKAFLQLEHYARALKVIGKLGNHEQVKLSVIQPFQQQALVREFRFS